MCQCRYEKLQEKVYKRGELLEEVFMALDIFLSSVTHFEEWYSQVVDVLESSDKLEADQLALKIEEIAEQRDERKDAFEETLKNGKALVVKKDIADTTPIREKIKGLELQWKDLNTVIDKSLKDGKARVDQLHAYEKLRDQVLEWLTKTEKRIEILEPVAVDADILKKQIDELKVDKLICVPHGEFLKYFISDYSRSLKNTATMKQPSTVSVI